MATAQVGNPYTHSGRIANPAERQGSTRMFVGRAEFETFKRRACSDYPQSKVRRTVKTPTAFDKTATAFIKTATAFDKTATAFDIFSCYQHGFL